MTIRWLLAAGLLGGFLVTTAGMLAPVYPPADILNHFRPWVLAGAGALLIGALAVGKPRLVWPGAALAGLNAVLLGVPLLWSAEPAERPRAGQALASAATREITLLSFNTRSGNAKAVASLILREDPDIVALQEVSASETNGLRVLLHERYPYSLVCTVVHRCGAAIFSKRAWATAGHEYWSTDAPEMVWIQLDDAEVGRLRVVGVHFALPYRAEWQTRQLRRLVAFRSALAGPVIVAGDFNMTPWSYRQQHLLAATGLRRHATFLRSWPTDGQFRLPWPTFLIDHVLSTPDIKSVAIRVGPNTGSDHLPVIARLGLPAG
jgi:endonuclease/exonuclease/phosphatase (EEP) superfamily protein YafD